MTAMPFWVLLDGLWDGLCTEMEKHAVLTLACPQGCGAMLWLPCVDIGAGSVDAC